MTAETVLTNARLVLPDRVTAGTVAIRDGRIAEIDQGRSALPGAVDLAGDFLLPGLVELHTDHLDKHMSPRPGVHWPELPAVLAHDAQLASAGITTVFDAVVLGFTASVRSRKKVLGRAVEGLKYARAEGLFRADHQLHLRCEVSDADVVELFETHSKDCEVALVSLMDHSPGERQFADVARFREYYTNRHGLSHEEVDAEIVRAERERARNIPYGRRKAIAEQCRDRGISLASHDDATEAHVEEAHELGVVIAEFPTTVAAARAAHGRRMTTVMGAPNLVRGGSHSGNVSAKELAEAGLLDAFSSDYVPVSLLHAAFVLADGDDDRLPAAVATVSSNPARMAGFDDRGELSAGYRADLIRVKAVGATPVVREAWVTGRRVL